MKLQVIFMKTGTCRFRPASDRSRRRSGAARPWPELLSWLFAVLSCCGFGCGGGASSAPRPLVAQAHGGAEGCDAERDRRAILEMAGSFEVRFRFKETLPLREGYEPEPLYEARAGEVVRVLGSSPERISLQHLLVFGDESDPTIMKHWRQVWTFEDRELLEYRGHDTWQRRTLSREEARCTWSQQVFQVDDGPRYEGYGRWRHEGGVSAWTSNPTWRPLPRRERKRADEYDVLISINRHTLIPDGWAHEQDSLKVALGDEPKTLVREAGLNRYRRTEMKRAPIDAQWEAVAEFWRIVREQWRSLLSKQPRVVVHPEAEGKKRYNVLFELAEAYGETEAGARTEATSTRQAIRAVLQRYVAAPDVGGRP